MNICLAFATLLATFFPIVDANAVSPPDQPNGPCVSEENRQFDFWLGEWDVEDPAGKHVGTNSITAILGGCVLMENWKGDGGMSGTSLNKYVVSTQQWHQTWMDDKGGFLTLDGQFKNGKMILQGKQKTRKGSDVINRISWTKVNENQVRQYWEQSTDDGKTWIVAFDGLYKRKKG